jgi:uncharacterized protein
MDLDQETTRAASLFAERLRARTPEAMALLFGSRVRGGHNAESDADVAVVLPDIQGSRASEAAALADMAFDILLETGVLVSPVPLTQREMDEPALFTNPALIESIRREGVAL